MRIEDSADFTTFLDKWGVTIVDTTFKSRVEDFFVGSDALLVDSSVANTLKAAISYGDGESRNLQYINVVYAGGSESIVLDCSIPMTVTSITENHELVSKAFTFYLI